MGEKSRTSNKALIRVTFSSPLQFSDANFPVIRPFLISSRVAITSIFIALHHPSIQLYADALTTTTRSLLLM
jgi:hypothetical protein